MVAPVWHFCSCWGWQHMYRPLSYIQTTVNILTRMSEYTWLYTRSAAVCAFCLPNTNSDLSSENCFGTSHLVHSHSDIPSKSWQCGRRCRKPSSFPPCRSTNSTPWTCVPSRWRGTPSRHPPPCRCRCCCRSWPKPGAAQTHSRCAVRQQPRSLLRKASRRCEAYLLVRVPHDMLDVLCVRVYDGDTLVLVFFIHWEAHREKYHSHTQEGRTRTCQTSDVVPHCSLTQTFPDPHTLVSATCCQQIPRRCPCHTFDLIFVSFQHGQTLKDKPKLWVSSSRATRTSMLRLSISSHLKIIVLLFPDARGCIKAGRSQVIPAGRPRQFSHSALVSILKHSLAFPRVTWKKRTVRWSAVKLFTLGLMSVNHHRNLTD